MTVHAWLRDHVFTLTEVIHSLLFTLGHKPLQSCQNLVGKSRRGLKKHSCSCIVLASFPRVFPPNIQMFGVCPSCSGPLAGRSSSHPWERKANKVAWCTWNESKNLVANQCPPEENHRARAQHALRPSTNAKLRVNIRVFNLKKHRLN